MRFHATPIAGVWLVELTLLQDERGFFARSFCREEFVQHGLEPAVMQCNVSFNRKRGTLRGMHFQSEPFPEAKLVRVTQGAAFDVAVDIRPNSPTYGAWHGVELSAANHLALYLPAGCAHGFQTLCDDTEMFYQMSEVYHAECSEGIRWNDPQIAIAWPLPDPVISDRDHALPTLHTWEQRRC